MTTRIIYLHSFYKSNFKTVFMHLVEFRCLKLVHYRLLWLCNSLEVDLFGQVAIVEPQRVPLLLQLHILQLEKGSSGIFYTFLVKLVNCVVHNKIYINIFKLWIVNKPRTKYSGAWKLKNSLECSISVHNYISA